MKKLVLILTFLTLPLSSYAQDAFYVSGMLGMGTFDVDDSNIDFDSELTYGLRGGLLFNDHVSAGLYLQRYKTDYSDAFNTDYETTLTNIMAEVTYYFAEADENTFWVSGLLGTTQYKVDSTVNDTTDSETAYGAAIGYHFMVAPNFSLSPQITYVRTGGDAEFTQISGLVNLTLWL